MLTFNTSSASLYSLRLAYVRQTDTTPTDLQRYSMIICSSAIISNKR